MSQDVLHLINNKHGFQWNTIINVLQTVFSPFATYQIPRFGIEDLSLMLSGIQCDMWRIVKIVVTKTPHWDFCIKQLYSVKVIENPMTAY